MARLHVTLGIGVFLAFALPLRSSATVLAGPITNPANGHDYYLLDAATWTASEAEAVSLGGHLTTIRNQAEEDFVYNTFTASRTVNRCLWIGLTVVGQPFPNFYWISGEPVTYTNWSPLEPNYPYEEYGHIFPPFDSRGGTWNNGTNDGCVGLAPTHGVVEVSGPLCDFSSEAGQERCFGGIGPGCAGFPLPFVKDDQTCLVAAWVSAGSILHDRCCLESLNTGYSCAIPFLGTNECKKEWSEAVQNVRCVATRAWQYALGPYPAGNTGDDTTRDLPAPPGAGVDPKYEYLCASGKCQVEVDAKGKTNTIIKRDLCGKYCECW